MDGAGHLSLKIGERIGAGGRSGVVYSADILTATREGDGAESSELLPHAQKLCIKIARPNRCRTLAWEAWVYDQLSIMQLQGGIVPHTYGVFTTDMPPNRITFPLWESEDLDLNLTCDDPADDPILVTFTCRTTDQQKMQ